MAQKYSSWGRHPLFFSWFLLLIYLVSQFYLENWIASWGNYAPYAVDLIFIAAVWIHLGIRSIRLGGQNSFQLGDFLWSIGMGCLGGLVFFGAHFFNFSIPFDVSNWEGILILVLFGPLLEEVLFRGALWGLFEKILKRPQWAWWMTSIVFSLAHFKVYFYLPEMYQGFVLYQSLYTLGLGLIWGWRYLQKRNLFPLILMHVAFNFGFYLMSLGVSEFSNR